MTKHTITALGYVKDHQDGGGSTTVYPNREAMVQALKEDYDFETDEEAEAKMKEIEEEEDTYENGEVRSFNIEVNVDENGVPSLAKDFYVSWGQ